MFSDNESAKERRILEILAVKWAEKYQKKFKRGTSRQEALESDPRNGMEYLLGNCFARAGGEQAGYSEIALNALQTCIGTAGSYSNFIRRSDAPDALWNQFKNFCEEQGTGVNEKNNKGVVIGIARLAQNSENNNPILYMKDCAANSLLEKAFITLTSMKGIGDKIASFLLRDVVCIFDLEKEVPSKDLIFLQPVDVWIRRIACHLWNDLNEDMTSDWVIARRIIQKCEEHDVSSLRFNQGAWYYGAYLIRDEAFVGQKIDELLEKV